jgi:alpha-galactosidase
LTCELGSCFSRALGLAPAKKPETKWCSSELNFGLGQPSCVTSLSAPTKRYRFRLSQPRAERAGSRFLGIQSPWTICTALLVVACGSSGTGSGAGGSPASAGTGAISGAGTSAAVGGTAGTTGTGGSSGTPSGGAATGGTTEPSAGTSGGGAGDGGGAMPSAGAGAGAGAGQGGAAGSGGGAPDGPLAAKPYMGWSSWSSTTGNIDEAKARASADVLASQLLQYGYQYINIDDGWSSGYDMYGRLKANTQRFPNGMQAVADYVHAKGLKFGIYMTPGVNDSVVSANSPIEGTSYHVKDIVTSAAGSTDRASGATSRKIDFSKPGAVEYVQGYANLFASWGVDFIKMDFVGPGGGGGNADNQDDVEQWRAALNKSGRQVWLELSNMLNISAIATWKGYSNGWRIANDVESYSTTLTNWTHVVRVIDALPPFAQYSGPGGWNDMDSLEIGAGAKDGITPDERQTCFSFWAINTAPLYIGADITALDPADLKILTNNEVIAVDQAAIPAKAVSTASTSQVWYSKQLDGSIVVGLFNFSSGSTQLTATFGQIGAGASMKVRDLVSQTDLGTSTTSFSATLPTHGSRLVRLTP